MTLGKKGVRHQGQCAASKANRSGNNSNVTIMPKQRAVGESLDNQTIHTHAKSKTHDRVGLGLVANVIECSELLISM